MISNTIESLCELLVQSTVRQNDLNREAQPIVSRGLLAALAAVQITGSTEDSGLRAALAAAQKKRLQRSLC